MAMPSSRISVVTWADIRPTMSVDVTVMPATVGQLPDVVASLGQREYFSDRLDRQGRGEGVLLVAWLDDQPVGDIYRHADHHPRRSHRRAARPHADRDRRGRRQPPGPRPVPPARLHRLGTRHRRHDLRQLHARRHRSPLPRDDSRPHEDAWCVDASSAVTSSGRGQAPAPAAARPTAH